MAWDFSTEPEYQRELDWMESFVREEVEPIDLVFPDPYDKSDPRARELTAPLKSLMNEILGRSSWAPSIFGPTEVHKISIAKRVLRDYKPSEGLFPSSHLPARVAAAREKFADILEREVGNL